MKPLRYLAVCGVAAALGPLALATPASADQPYFFGHWRNVDPNTNNLTRVGIDPSGGWNTDVHGFGACHPTDCDWGHADGHYEHNFGWGNDRIKATFNSGFSITRLELRPAPGDRLHYNMHVKFTDHSGRSPYDIDGILFREGGGGYGPGGPGGGGYGPGGPGGGGYGPGGGGGYGPGGGGPGGGGGYGPGGPGGGPGGGGYGPPPGPSLGAEDCISFDPSQVTASYTGGDWKVVQGSMWMLDYGSNSSAANHAADVIHHYHFTQQCFVKRPNASMMYWKSGNIVRTGDMPGEDCIGLNPNNASVSHVGGAWKVVDGSNWLLDYGSDHGADDQALAVIQTYHLNRQCFVQRPNAPMQYWLAQ